MKRVGNSIVTAADTHFCSVWAFTFIIIGSVFFCLLLPAFLICCLCPCCYLFQRRQKGRVIVEPPQQQTVVGQGGVVVATSATPNQQQGEFEDQIKVTLLVLVECDHFGSSAVSVYPMPYPPQQQQQPPSYADVTYPTKY